MFSWEKDKADGRPKETICGTLLSTSCKTFIRGRAASDAEVIWFS